MKKQLIRFSDSESMVKGSADYICKMASIAIADNGRFSIALSGGRSPQHLYRTLAMDEYAGLIDWSRVHIFWSDERCVPPTDSDSNYGLAFDAFLSKIRIPEENIHRIPAEIESPSKAASLYEDDLKNFFSNSDSLFDLCLLGLGTDGHTASIFPGASLDESKLVVATIAPDQMPVKNRISLTTSAINRSTATLFIVSGSGKGNITEKILSDSPTAESEYPAARINPTQELIWHIDEGAL